MFLVDKNCRTVEFKEERKNEVLINHVSHRYYGVDKDICQINCYREPGCVSYNHGTLSDGTFLCELNDKDHTQASSNEMVARYGFIYRPILVRDDVINKLYSPMKRLEGQKNDPLSNSINFFFRIPVEAAPAPDIPNANQVLETRNITVVVYLASMEKNVN